MQPENVLLRIEFPTIQGWCALCTKHAAWNIVWASRLPDRDRCKKERQQSQHSFRHIYDNLSENETGRLLESYKKNIMKLIIFETSSEFFMNIL